MRRDRIMGAGVATVGAALVAVTLISGTGRFTWYIGLALTAWGVLWVFSTVFDGRRGLRTAVALGVIAATVALVLLPGWLVGRGNDASTAWRVPNDETIEHARAGLAVLRDRRGGESFTARDLTDGRVLWRTRRAPRSQNVDVDGISWSRAGGVLLAEGGPSYGLTALDARTGRLRFTVDQSDRFRPVLASERTVAMTACGARACSVQARDLRTGAVRWTSRTKIEGDSLGAPESSSEPWPATVALVTESGTADVWRYAVRDLDTGEVLRRAELSPRGTLGLAAGGTLMSSPDGRSIVRGEDARTGKGRWTVRLDGDRVPATDPARQLGLPDGWLARNPQPDAVRLIDPADGREVTIPIPGPAEPVVLFPTDASRPTPAEHLVVRLGLSTAGLAFANLDRVAARIPGPFGFVERNADTVAVGTGERPDLTGKSYTGAALYDVASGRRFGQLRLGEGAEVEVLGDALVMTDRSGEPVRVIGRAGA